MDAEVNQRTTARIAVSVIPPDLEPRSGPAVVASCLDRGPVAFTDAVVDLFTMWDDGWDEPETFGATPDNVSLYAPGGRRETVDDAGQSWYGAAVPSHPVYPADDMFPNSWVAQGTSGFVTLGYERIDPAEALRALLDWDGSDAGTLAFIRRFGLLPSVDQRLVMDPLLPEERWAEPFDLQLAGPDFRLGAALAGEPFTFDVNHVQVHDLAEQSWLLAAFQRAARVALAILDDPNVELGLAVFNWDGEVHKESPSYRTEISDRRFPPAMLEGRPQPVRASLNHLEHYLETRLLAPAGRPISFSVETPSDHPAVADHNVVMRRRPISPSGKSDAPPPPGTIDYDAEPDSGRVWAAICRHILGLFQSQFGSCQRCGTPFPMTRKDKRYCTASCANAYRQHLHRRRRRTNSSRRR